MMDVKMEKTISVRRNRVFEKKNHFYNILDEQTQQTRSHVKVLLLD